jgi:hypothetical protein
LDLPHFRLHQVGGLALGLGDGAYDQVGQQLGVAALERLGINDDRAHPELSIDGGAHQSSTRAGLDGAAGQLNLELLQPALYLLAQLEELL